MQYDNQFIPSIPVDGKITAFVATGYPVNQADVI
jgi:hypothetical protein